MYPEMYADAHQGGEGFMSRAHGLAIDSLVAMDVVLANGSLVHATTSAYPDVFFVRNLPQNYSDSALFCLRG